MQLLKITTAFLIFFIFLFSCSKNDTTISPPEFSTISEKEIRVFCDHIEEILLQKMSAQGYLDVSADIKNTSYRSIGAASATYVPLFKNKESGVNIQLILIKYNNKINSVVTVIRPDENWYNDGKNLSEMNGYIDYFASNGSFIKSVRLNGGLNAPSTIELSKSDFLPDLKLRKKIFKNNLNKNLQSSLAVAIGGGSCNSCHGEDPCQGRWGEFGCKELPEVVIPGKPKDPPTVIPPSGPSIPIFPNPLPDNPCNEAKALNQRTEYKNKVNELKGKTGLKYESGYEENKNGTFKALTPSGSTVNSDGLNANVSKDTKGFMHTHQDKYETGENTDEGSVVRIPIKMFSPADVNALMEIVSQNANSSDYSSFYVSMITSNNHYMIKFTGNSSQIKTGFNSTEWQLKYQQYMRSAFNLEKAFLKFIKNEMKLEGVTLFKVKKDGNIEKRMLDNNGTIKKVPC